MIDGVKQVLRPVRSFVCRQGRMTLAQRDALVSLWPIYGVSVSAESYDWTHLFDRPAPLILDIGFGQGQSLIELAQYYPDHNVLGVEVHRPGIGQAMHLAKTFGLFNIKIIAGDVATLLPTMIPTDSLSRVYILFSDPWHKTRHQKRRLIKQPFVTQLVSKLQKGGVIHLATDWEDYAHQIASVMGKLENLQKQSPETNWRPHTKYEQRGLCLGYTIYDLVYLKS